MCNRYNLKFEIHHAQKILHHLNYRTPPRNILFSKLAVGGWEQFEPRRERRRAFETSSCPALSSSWSPGRNRDRTGVGRESQGILTDSAGVRPTFPAFGSLFGVQGNPATRVVQLRETLLEWGRWRWSIASQKSLLQNQARSRNRTQSDKSG